jgi:hypothetical protein
MPFSRKVRDRALVAAARHCCVCHKRRGLNVEVHHIIPEAKGGANRFENAIVLCFDCHADAGHYNPNHPKGTKFSPTELVLARDEWHRIVREHKIPPEHGENLLHCRYIICKSFEALHEIAEANLSHFPLTPVVMARTSPLAFIRKVLSVHRQPFRSEEVESDVFPDRDSYLRAHPDVRTSRVNRTGFDYFEYERIPSRTELRWIAGEEDGITRLLLDADIDPTLIARALGYDEMCGGGFREILRVRPLWFVFLAITNTSETQVRVTGLTASIAGTDHRDLQPIRNNTALRKVSIELPRSTILPQATVVVPIATVLGPLEHVPFEEAGFEESKELQFAHSQTFSHVKAAEERSTLSLCWGPTIYPATVQVEANGGVHEQEVHSLDLTNVYEIDRYWAMGSCPHVIAISDSGELEYLGEVLSDGLNQWTMSSIEVPTNCRTIVIAEIEEETTIVRSISSGSTVLHRNFTLQKGEYLLIQAPGPTLTLHGMYVPSVPGAGIAPPNPIRRNELVGNFMSRLHTEQTLPPPAITAVAAAD